MTKLKVQKRNKLNKSDYRLIELGKKYLEKYYKKNHHHTTCVLMTKKNRVYKSLHLDVRGFDVCAEPIALSNALINNETIFKTVVTIIKINDKLEVVNPCGNCRQMFYTYSPNINIILNDNGNLLKRKAKDLLPYPY